MSKGGKEGGKRVKGGSEEMCDVFVKTVRANAH